jgi:hypothetical protein
MPSNVLELHLDGAQVPAPEVKKGQAVRREETRYNLGLHKFYSGRKTSRETPCKDTGQGMAQGGAYQNPDMVTQEEERGKLRFISPSKR